MALKNALGKEGKKKRGKYEAAARGRTIPSGEKQKTFSPRLRSLRSLRERLRLRLRSGLCRRAGRSGRRRFRRGRGWLSRFQRGRRRGGRRVGSRCRGRGRRRARSRFGLHHRRTRRLHSAARLALGRRRASAMSPYVAFRLLGVFRRLRLFLLAVVG